MSIQTKLYIAIQIRSTPDGSQEYSPLGAFLTRERAIEYIHETEGVNYACSYEIMEVEVKS